MTIKLYDNDSYLTQFEATVLNCEQTKKGYKIELDQTVFFPEEGGQCCDRGTINEAVVNYVELDGSTIYHYTDYPFEIGEKIQGKIDFELRYINMQNHSGEHVISGLAHNLYGCENVGFHLGDGYVTMDVDKPLTSEQLATIEKKANEIIYMNVPITAEYPAKEQLSQINYRAKLDLMDNVRIVSIGDMDKCACCAPHVAKTGEIGIIKILDAINYKGGMRLNILCGSLAVNDYGERFKRNVEISNLLSAKQPEIVDAVKKLCDDNGKLKQKINEIYSKMAVSIANSAAESNGNLCVFCEDLPANYLQTVASALAQKSNGVAVAFTGNDEEGYKYTMAVKDGDVMPFVKQANEALNGRGGGKGSVASGSFAATKTEIEKYFG